mmetsp:Transcript_13285/g.28382  ORF Transcript_13285/g.28382 Transcript_13285/m.28382 type:complete len:435 (+) Transcript_13285:1606-2910(+)
MHPRQNKGPSCPVQPCPQNTFALMLWKVHCSAHAGCQVGAAAESHALEHGNGQTAPRSYGTPHSRPQGAVLQPGEAAAVDSDDRPRAGDGANQPLRCQRVELVPPQVHIRQPQPRHHQASDSGSVFCVLQVRRCQAQRVKQRPRRDDLCAKLYLLHCFPRRYNSLPHQRYLGWSQPQRHFHQRLVCKIAGEHVPPRVWALRLQRPAAKVRARRVRAPLHLRRARPLLAQPDDRPLLVQQAHLEVEHLVDQLLVPLVVVEVRRLQRLVPRVRRLEQQHQRGSIHPEHRGVRRRPRSRRPREPLIRRGEAQRTARVAPRVVPQLAILPAECKEEPSTHCGARAHALGKGIAKGRGEAAVERHSQHPPVCIAGDPDQVSRSEFRPPLRGHSVPIQVEVVEAEARKLLLLCDAVHPPRDCAPPAEPGLLLLASGRAQA